MKETLNKYNAKRDFKKTKEPVGKIVKEAKSRFAVQHHIARRDHYDFRLEYDGVLLSFAVPKGPSYNPNDKRLAVHVENHPVSYLKFEGTIPEGEYGAGTVMLWDIGTYTEIEPFKKTYPKGYLKLKLNGKRLKGTWMLTAFQDDNWLLIKEKDNIKLFDDINEFDTSIKTNRTMDEIKNNKRKKKKLPEIKITNPDKIMYKNSKVTKKDVINYYEKVADRMLPFIEYRLLSVVRAPNGTNEERFFKKHFPENPYLSKHKVKNKDGKNEYFYYITDEAGLISEAQMNSIEFHVGGSTVNDRNHPNIMVFDLDPDERLSVNKIREGVRDLKKILDSLKLKSYLKTSGGKGYHIVVPLKTKVTWQKFEHIALDIATLMEKKYPDKYTTNIRKEKRIGKIFIDYLRNTKGSTSVAPYSLRARNNATVSMPIKWSELDKIKPNEITINDALKRLKRKDPWEGFFS